MTNLPRQLARTEIYHSPWVNLFVDRVAMPDGWIIERHHVLDFPQPGVIALVVRDDGAVLFEEAYRYVTGSVGWELPAGRPEGDEEILAAAQREVLEETGYHTSAPELIYTYYPASGIANLTFHVVRCRAEADTGVFDRNEVRTVRWCPRAEIAALVRDGTIRDGFSLTALLLYLLEPMEPAHGEPGGEGGA
jgi:ADP-ribose pyrophosphatase